MVLALTKTMFKAKPSRPRPLTPKAKAWTLKAKFKAWTLKAKAATLWP